MKDMIVKQYFIWNNTTQNRHQPGNQGCTLNVVSGKFE